MSYRNEEPEINLRAVLDKLPFKFGRISGGNSFSYIVIAIVSIILVVWLLTGFYTVEFSTAVDPYLYIIFTVHQTKILSGKTAILGGQVIIN